VVVAAGNDGRINTLGNQGYATILAPGNSPYAITVGAMNTGGTVTESADKIASYSSKGPSLLDHVVKPDLVAPVTVSNSILKASFPSGKTGAQKYG
jgi:serine protease AprX